MDYRYVGRESFCQRRQSTQRYPLPVSDFEVLLSDWGVKEELRLGKICSNFLKVL